MNVNKNVVILLAACLMLWAACASDATKTSEANQDVMDNQNALSTDLVNNPTSSDFQNIDSSQTGLLVFTDTVHDFGTLVEGEVIQHEFEYTNKGSKEVIITDAKGSCGCTVPAYDTKPIKPGGTGIMKVTFDSKGKVGFNEKNVQINTNGLPSNYRLTILATVEKK